MAVQSRHKKLSSTLSITSTNLFCSKEAHMRKNWVEKFRQSAKMRRFVRCVSSVSKINSPKEENLGVILSETSSRNTLSVRIWDGKQNRFWRLLPRKSISTTEDVLSSLSNFKLGQQVIVKNPVVASTTYPHRYLWWSDQTGICNSAQICPLKIISFSSVLRMIQHACRKRLFMSYCSYMLNTLKMEASSNQYQVHQRRLRLILPFSGENWFRECVRNRSIWKCTPDQ